MDGHAFGGGWVTVVVLMLLYCHVCDGQNGLHVRPCVQGVDQDAIISNAVNEPNGLVCCLLRTVPRCDCDCDLYLTINGLYGI